MKLKLNGLYAAIDAFNEDGYVIAKSSGGKMHAAIEAYLTATNSVIVPCEPTEAMLKAGEIPTRSIPLGNGTTTEGLGLGATAHNIYRRMIQAAQAQGD